MLATANTALVRALVVSVDVNMAARKKNDVRLNPGYLSTGAAPPRFAC